MTEREIFVAALHQPGPAERRAFLNRACGADTGLRGRVEELLAEHDRLGSFLEQPAVGRPGADADPEPHPAAPIGAFDDYEIVREAGRGGMGVVYEARQLSLGGRRVALKVLPFAAALEPRLLQRFRVEAQAAALLNHPHIVPVYGVGSERGVPFYAMQFIDGRSMADLIGDLRRHDRVPTAGPAPGADFTLPRRVTSEEFAAGEAALNGPVPSTLSVTGEVPGEPEPSAPAARARWATAHSSNARAFSRTVASFGIQAADALEHAHERGVLHRDIKPSNLIIDEGGALWVTDFGLARLQDDPELTQSGDLLGTLRYMSPEQAQGRRAVIDHRTDVYSLGATLYELLTLEPAIAGGDRHEVLRRVVEDEPRPIRQLNPTVSADLATIIGKAMAKDPQDRYGTAGALADDLRRFLEHRPIAARPPTLLERAAKWARRRPMAAALVLVSVVATVAMAGAITGWAFYSRLHAAMQRAEQAQRAEAVARQGERRLRYYHDIALAQAAWRDGNLQQVLERLDGCPPEYRRWEWHYLRRLCRAGLMSMRGHTSGVLDVAVSPDGTRIASASDDQTARVWDSRTGEAVLTLRGQSQSVPSVAFSPDGTRIVTADAAGGARIWDSRTGRELLRLVGHGRATFDVAFHPDGQRVAGIGTDGTSSIWDTTTGREVVALHVPDVLGSGVAFSPDGDRVASAISDGRVIVWDAKTGHELLTLRGHAGTVRRVAFSPDGARIASAGSDQTVRVWDAATGRELLTLRGHPSVVNDVAFSPDGGRLASAGGDATVRIWDVSAGPAPASRELLTLRGHFSSVLGVAFVGPDGRRLVSSGADHAVKVWDAGSSPESVTLTGCGRSAPAIAISPDGKLLASGDDGGRTRVWDLAGGQVIETLHGHAKDGDAKPVSAVAFSPDGRWLATGGWDDVVRVWDAKTWKPALTLRGHKRGITCLAFDPVRPRVASGSGDRTLKVWDLATGREVFELGGYVDEVSTVAYSRDGQFLARAGNRRPVTLHEAATGAERFALPGSGGDVMCVAFGVDGTSLASCGWHQTVEIWDLKTRERRAVLRGGHTEGILGLAFSPDGLRLASSGADHVVKVWDLADRREALGLRGHTNLVHDVAFSPDGGRLITAGGDGTVRIWDGRPLPARAPTGRAATR